jgi:rSAM/selenodomain-associated transferase 2
VLSTLSIIVPARNEGPYIQACLRPLQRYRREGAEVILVDGGSSDETCSRAAPLVDQLIASEPGRGIQLRKGADCARGEHLLFLHADTRLPHEGAEAAVRALVEGRYWGRFDVRLSGRHSMLRIIEKMMNLRSCLTGIATGDQAMFMTRAAYEQAGRFAEIPLMEDIELSRRLRRIERPVCLSIPALTSSRRWEQHGIVRTVLLMWRLRLAFFFGADPSRLAELYRRSGNSRR